MKSNVIYLPSVKKYFIMLVIIVVASFMYPIMAYSRDKPWTIFIGFGILLLMLQMQRANIARNGIRISENQFPEVFEMATQIVSELKLKRMPELYALQEGELLNAWTLGMKRNHIVIHTRLIAIGKKRPDILRFILAHEMGHVVQEDGMWRILLFPATLIPGLGGLYLRSCEYKADELACSLGPEGEVKGAVDALLLVAYGESIYKSIDTEAFLNEEKALGYWSRFREAVGGYPSIRRRIKRILDRQKVLREMTNKLEQRGVSRIEADLPVTIKNKPGNFTLKNISTSGVFIKTDKPECFMVLDSLCIQIGPVTDSKIIKLKARVVRKTEEGIGCCFTEVTSEQERDIETWINVWKTQQFLCF